MMSAENRMEEIADGIYQFRDSCNVYAIRRNGRGLLIDSGTGAIAEHLSGIGIEAVDWILHTHHHRDQCQGTSVIVAGSSAKVAVPAVEADYFESAEALWRLQQVFRLYDCANVFNRPISDVLVDRQLEDYEVLTWQGLDIWVLPTPGHTRGSVSYVVDIDGVRWAFSGDLIYSSGRVWSLHDMHWDYSNPDGLEAAMHSAQLLAGKGLDRVAPSHGDTVDSPTDALVALQANLLELHSIVGTGYIGDISPPMAVRPKIRALSPHLIEVTQSNANFYVLRDDDGHALMFDYGFPDTAHVSGARSRFVEHSIDELRTNHGVTEIEAFIPTHYHDDHVAGAWYLQEYLGTEVWAFELFADVLARPSAYRLPALWGKATRPDMTFGDKDVIEWRGYEFEARHCPGHTRYAVALFGEIDGRRTVISGDEIQLDGRGDFRGGGPVYPNGFRKSDFSVGINRIMEWQPEVLLTGHDGTLVVSAKMIQELENWTDRLERSLVRLAADPEEVESAVDRTPVRIMPYHSYGSPGQPSNILVEISNHGHARAIAELHPVLPDGWLAKPAVEHVEILGRGAGAVEFEIFPAADAALGRWVIAIDVTLGDRRMGQVAEGLITVTPRDKATLDSES